MNLKDRVRALRERTGDDRLSVKELGFLDALERPIVQAGSRVWTAHFYRSRGMVWGDPELLKQDSYEFLLPAEREKLEHYVNWIENCAREERAKPKKHHYIRYKPIRDMMPNQPDHNPLEEINANLVQGEILRHPSSDP